ncbi:MAG: hypothetical protein RIE87_01830 [Rhodospirillales bacterium]
MIQTVDFQNSVAAVRRPGQPVAYYLGGTAAGGSIDLCAMIASHAYDWLEDLAAAHAEIIEAEAARSGDIWLSGASRLDARPWGQAALIKPLFFARAIVRWLEENPGAPGLAVVDASPDVARHLREMAPEIRVTGTGEAAGRTPSAAVRFIRLTIWAWRDMIAMIRNHRGLQCRPGTTARALLLVQPVRGRPFRDAHTYFFTTLLDERSAAGVAVAVTGTVDRAARAAAPGSVEQSDPLCLFDGVTPGEALTAFIAAVVYAARVHLHLPRAGAQARGIGHTALFWRRFANQLVDPGELFHALIVRSRLARLISGGGFRKVVFPYEEKGIERAVIQACATQQAATLGYVPHPQHRLLVALQDRRASTCPKPDGYALCGNAYIDFFRTWAAKTSAPLAVWGSGKGIVEAAEPRPARQGRRSVVLALSHPEEVILLGIWLKCRPDITREVDLGLRPYPAADPVLFDRALTEIRRTHPAVAVSTGDLRSDVRHHDAVAFCATSAGLEAVIMGAVGLFVDLTDGFPINPCFDDTSAFRPSSTAGELAGNLAWLAQADEDALHNLRTRQIAAASQIFGPPDKSAVLQSVRCP